MKYNNNNNNSRRLTIKEHAQSFYITSSFKVERHWLLYQVSTIKRSMVDYLNYNLKSTILVVTVLVVTVLLFARLHKSLVGTRRRVLPSKSLEKTTPANLDCRRRPHGTNVGSCTCTVCRPVSDHREEEPSFTPHESHQFDAAESGVHVCFGPFK